jgi:hypothetical protein
VITVVFRSAFIRPHGGLLSNQTAFLESQPIHTIQEVLRRTLSANTDGLPVECMHAALAGSANGAAAIGGECDLGSQTENANAVNLLFQTSVVTLAEVLATHSQGAPPFIVKIDIESSDGAFAGDTQWISHVPVIIAELRDSLIPGTDKVHAFVDCVSGLNRDFIYLHDNIFSISREIAA